MCQECVDKGVMTTADLERARQERNLRKVPYVEMTVSEVLDSLDGQVRDDAANGVPLEATFLLFDAVRRAYLMEYPERAPAFEAEMTKRILARVSELTPEERALLAPETQRHLSTLQN